MSERMSTHVRVVVAFTLGCFAATMTGALTARPSAQAASTSIHVCVDKGVLRLTAPSATCPAGQQSLTLQKATPQVAGNQTDESSSQATSPVDQAALADLNRRLAKLEQMGCAALSKNKVVAPFQVIDRAGKRVFYVNDGLAEIYNASESPVARMDASKAGGSFIAVSESGGLAAALGSRGQGFGLYLSEHDQQTVELGRRPTGNYALLFSHGGKTVAGLGETTDGSGEALVDDRNGVPKVLMDVGTDGKGRILVTADGKGPLAQLTEGQHGGGLMFLCKPGNCDPPMVDAGDAGGYGLVRVGPLGFNPGLGLVGAPGSVLVGRKQ